MANIGGKVRPATTSLRGEVVALWNTERLSQDQIAGRVSTSRGAVGRLLSEARKSGMAVFSPGSRGAGPWFRPPRPKGER